MARHFKEKIVRDLYWVLQSPNILKIDIEDCSQLSESELLGDLEAGA